LSQEQLGIEVGHEQPWISNIENGKANPAYGTVDAIARALGWPVSKLVALLESVETEDRRPLDRPISHS
jgi:transcriptional regulator with XRE-family HTH domain